MRGMIPLGRMGRKDEPAGLSKVLAWGSAIPPEVRGLFLFLALLSVVLATFIVINEFNMEGELRYMRKMSYDGEDMYYTVAVPTRRYPPPWSHTSRPEIKLHDYGNDGTLDYVVDHTEGVEGESPELLCEYVERFVCAKHLAKPVRSEYW